MSDTLAPFTAGSIDLSDEDVMQAFLRLAGELAELGPGELRALRFARDAYRGAADPHALTAVFGPDDEVRRLRTLSSVALSVGGSEKDYLITFQRTSPGNATISVEPTGFRTLAAARDTATSRLQQLSAGRGQGTPHQQQQREAERPAAEQAAQNASSALLALADELARRMLVCVSACHRVGLVRPSFDTAAPAGTDGSVAALAAEVAALRASILSQQRNAADHARKIADDHEQRATALRLEHEERATRLETEFNAREQRLEEAIRAREAVAQAKLNAVAAREANLELNDEKAERRKLRRELQQATKARADKPDLSEQAKDAFARVTKASGSTVIVSAAILIAAVGGPFWLARGSTFPAELTYLAWSLRGLAGITLGAALIHYIRSLAQRARLIAETEVRSRQFALDVDRAQWLVEMALEYDKSSKPISPDLIAAFSRGLFEADHRTAQDSGVPLTDLLINADGLELSLSKRGVKRALRTIATHQDPSA